MKTVRQHNEDRRALKALLDATANASGLACEHCGEEMQYVNNHTLTTDPPKREVRCKCGARDYVLT